MVPIDFNNGCLTPTVGYLAAARELTHEAGALLLFDEVLSGFKTGLGGAQTLYGVTPDLTMLSKAMSSGVPLSAVVGQRTFMETLLKPVPAGAIEGGTFAGSVMGLAAAEATLTHPLRARLLPELIGRAAALLCRSSGRLRSSPLPGRVQSVGTMFASTSVPANPSGAMPTYGHWISDLRRRSSDA